MEIIRCQQQVHIAANLLIFFVFCFSINVALPIFFDFPKNKKISKCVAFILGLICVACMFTSHSFMNKAQKLRSEANYEIYLDGNLVDKDKIDISLYKSSFDDENKRIYLTNAGIR